MCIGFQGPPVVTINEKIMLNVNRQLRCHRDQFGPEVILKVEEKRQHKLRDTTKK